MSVKRFFSATSRDAIKQVRAELGDEAVILSNREVDGGVEVIASAEDDIAALIDRSPRSAKIAPGAGKALEMARAKARAEASMPTLARVAQAAQARQGKSTAPAPAGRERTDTPARRAVEPPVAESFADFVQRSESTRAARQGKVDTPVRSVASAPAVASVKSDSRGETDPHLMAEIQQMKSLLKEQMGVLSWNDMTSRRPLQAKLIASVLSAGFSPALARALADKLPADFNDDQATAWFRDNLIRNLAVSPIEGDMVDRGGVFALVGPTGVGKTTTAAKLAARCAVKYGAKSLGLITVDNYRIGAEDQLRAYGKILGVTVHTARDARTLAEVVSLMRDKHLVLIDTVGMGQRDSRLTEQMEMLSAPGIDRVLFLNAAAQGETLEDVVRLYSAQGSRRTTKVIVSKIDEAVKYGFALDCVIRHRLEIQYVTNGQRVPEDLHPANAQYLVHRALKHAAAPAFALSSAEIPLVFSTAAAAKPAARGAAGV